MSDNERKELLQKAKPILFNTDMVRAILDGRKTVTRRVLKPQPLFLSSLVIPPYKVGDILYVRETWAINNITPHDPDFVYKADYDCAIKPYCEWKWHPSIRMPKEAARIFMKVTNVRVERLQDCGNMQAKDEGCNCCSQFARIWDSTIKKSDLDKYGWAADPWVWVIEFERID